MATSTTSVFGRPRIKRHISIWAAIFLIASMAQAALSTPQANASGANPTPPNVVAQSGFSDYELTNVTCPTSSDCIAVGYAPEPLSDTTSTPILQSSDGGQTFVQVASPQTSQWGLVGVTCSQYPTCFAYGGGPTQGYLFRSGNGGTTWSNVTGTLSSAGTIYGISCSSYPACTVVGFNPSNASAPTAPFIYSTTNAGASPPTWTLDTVPSQVAGITGIDCPSASLCLASGIATANGSSGQFYGAGIVESTNGGKNWSLVVSAPSTAVASGQSSTNYPGLNAVSCASSDYCYFMGGSTTSGLSPDAYWTTDGGTTFSSETLSDSTYGTAPQDMGIYGLSCFASTASTGYGNCYAAGQMPSSAYNVIYTINLGGSLAPSGSIYQQSSLNYGLWGVGCLGTTGNCVYVGGEASTSPLSANAEAGIVYNPSTIYLGSFVRPLHPSSPSGERPNLVATVFGNQGSWNPSAIPNTTWFESITCPGSNISSCVLLHSTSSNDFNTYTSGFTPSAYSTSPSPSDVPYQLGCPSGTTDCIGVTPAGTAILSTDGGVTWSYATLSGSYNALQDAQIGVQGGNSNLSSIKCPSPTVCVDLSIASSYTQYNLVFMTIDWAAGTVSMTTSSPMPDSGYFAYDFSCPTTTMCAVLDSPTFGTPALDVTTDGGATWTSDPGAVSGFMDPQIFASTPDQLGSVSCPSTQVCYVLGMAYNQNSGMTFPAINMTGDGGTTWDQVQMTNGALQNDFGNTNVTAVPGSISCASVTSCAAVATDYNQQTNTSNPYVFATNNGGESWSFVQGPDQYSDGNPLGAINGLSNEYQVPITPEIACPQKTTGVSCSLVFSGSNGMAAGTAYDIEIDIPAPTPMACPPGELPQITATTGTSQTTYALMPFPDGLSASVTCNGNPAQNVPVAFQVVNVGGQSTSWGWNDLGGSTGAAVGTTDSTGNTTVSPPSALKNIGSNQIVSSIDEYGIGFSQNTGTDGIGNLQVNQDPAWAAWTSLAGPQISYGQYTLTVNEPICQSTNYVDTSVGGGGQSTPAGSTFNTPLSTRYTCEATGGPPPAPVATEFLAPGPNGPATTTNGTDWSPTNLNGVLTLDPSCVGGTCFAFSLASYPTSVNNPTYDWQLVQGSPSQGSWQVDGSAPPFPGESPRALSCVSATTCYTIANSSGGSPVLAEGTISKGSVTWTQASTPIPSPSGNPSTFGGLTCTATNTCYTWLGNSGVSYTTDGGSSWTTTSPSSSLPNIVMEHAPSNALFQTLESPSCPVTGTCYLLGAYPNGSQGLITLTVTSGGSTWSINPLPAGGPVQATALSCPALGVCTVGGGGYPGKYVPFATTSNGGGSWTLGSVSGSYSGYGDVLSLACPSSSDCYAYGQFASASDPANPSLLVSSTDGGKTWDSASFAGSAPRVLGNAIECTGNDSCILTGAAITSKEALLAQQLGQPLSSDTSGANNTWSGQPQTESLTNTTGVAIATTATANNIAGQYSDISLPLSLFNSNPGTFGVSNFSYLLSNSQMSSTTTVSASTSMLVSGSTVTLVATVKNGSGSPVTSGQVVFSYLAPNSTSPVIIGSASLDSSGQASTSVTDLPIGKNTVIADFQGNASVGPSSGSTTATIVSNTGEGCPSPKITSVVGSNQSQQVGQTFNTPLVVGYSCDGTPLQGITIAWSQTPGSNGAGGTMSPSSVTNSSGNAQVTPKANSFVGNWTATASVSGGATQFFLTNTQLPLVANPSLGPSGSAPPSIVPPPPIESKVVLPPSQPVNLVPVPVTSPAEIVAPPRVSAPAPIPSNKKPVAPRKYRAISSSLAVCTFPANDGNPLLSGTVKDVDFWLFVILSAVTAIYYRYHNRRGLTEAESAEELRRRAGI